VDDDPAYSGRMIGRGILAKQFGDIDPERGRRHCMSMAEM